MHHAHSDKPERRRWLCVAYAFPPIHRSGTFRTLGFVRHLERLGWDATVLTVDPGGEQRDPALLESIPPGTRIVRTKWIDLVDAAKSLWPAGGATFLHSNPLRLKAQCGFSSPRDGGPIRRLASLMRTATWTALHAVKNCASELLQTPDSRLGWLAPALRAGLDAVRTDKPEVIYSTSPYMTAHLIAALLSKLTRTPWVADFRDPWRGNPFETPRSPIASAWDAALEWAVLRAADRIVCASPAMTQLLVHRCPFARHKSATILNGFDAELLDDLQPQRLVDMDRFALVHAGRFYGPRSPRVWFDALRRIKARAPLLARRLQFVQLGPCDYAGKSLTEMAKEMGVSEMFLAAKERSHREALSAMAAADALALGGVKGRGADLQIPNKLFEYLALRRPIIATASASSPIVEILREARAESVVVAPDNANDLAEAIERLVRNRRVPVYDAWSGVDRFRREARALELAAIFEQVPRPSRRRRRTLLAKREMPRVAAARSGTIGKQEWARSRLGVPSDAWYRAAVHTGGQGDRTNGEFPAPLRLATVGDIA